VNQRALLAVLLQMAGIVWFLYGLNQAVAFSLFLRDWDSSSEFVWVVVGNMALAAATFVFAHPIAALLYRRRVPEEASAGLLPSHLLRLGAYVAGLYALLRAAEYLVLLVVRLATDPGVEYGEGSGLRVAVSFSVYAALAFVLLFGVRRVGSGMRRLFSGVERTDTAP
jgi:hypothetical protein